MPEIEPSLTLDDDHVYRLDGKIIPGCTSILKAFGCYDGLRFLSKEDREWHAERGRAIAKMVELDTRGTLDKRTLDRVVRPYWPGWEKAKRELGIKVLTINGEPFVEKILCHRMPAYGVKPDVVAYVEAYGGSGVIEIKATAQHSAATELQTAAQLLAVRQVLPEIGKVRIGLRLFPDPPYYEMKPYDERSDEAVWKSMVNTYNWLVSKKFLRSNGGR